MPSTNSSPEVRSYQELRQAIGILGTALPFVLSIGACVIFGTGIQSSLSRYYHTEMGGVFVATLCAIGVFLYFYKGYPATGLRDNDNLVGNVAGVSAIGVALFATEPSGNAEIPTTFIGRVHVCFAALLFASLAYFCLYLFKKTDPNKHPTEQKLRRNRIYKVSGWTIVVSIVLVGVQALLPAEIRQVLIPYNPAFWLEAIAVVAFSVAWLIKGQRTLKDQT